MSNKYTTFEACVCPNQLWLRNQHSEFSMRPKKSSSVIAGIVSAGEMSNVFTESHP